MTDGPGPVAVVGAGIGGLTLAIALHRRGVPVTVYERARELREVGAAVGLSANGLALLAELGLLGSLDDAGSEPVEFAYRSWRTAERLHGFPVGREGTYRSRFGTPWLGIHRAEFQRVLGAACPPGVLHLGRSVERITDHGDTVELGLGDGSTAEAAIVVGADGVHSRTRALVDPHAVPVYTGSSGFRGLVPVTDVPLLPGADAIQLWMGPDAHVVHYPIGRHAETVNFLAVFEGPDPWDGPPGPWAQPPGTLSHLVRDWSPGIRQMLDAVPQSDRWPLYTLPPMRRWSHGRVVLLGDAVHTMVPHHGQGANQTVEDVAVLVGCLTAEPDHARAFARYERLRRPRARQVTRSSLVTGPWLHLPDGERADRRDAGLAAVGPWIGWIHGHDVRADLDRT